LALFVITEAYVAIGQANATGYLAAMKMAWLKMSIINLISCVHNIFLALLQ